MTSTTGARRHRSLLRGAATVGGFTLVAKGVAGVRDILVGRSFGVSDEVDAFFLAFTVASTAAGVVISSVHLALIPTWVQARDRDGPDGAARLLRNSSGLVTVALVVFIALTALCSGPLVAVLGSGFDDDKRALTQSLLLILLPLVLAAGLGGVATGVLQARHRLGVASAAQALNPGTVVVVLVVWQGSLGIRGLAGATTAGFAVEAVAVLIAAAVLGTRVWPGWSGMDRRTRVFVGQVGPALVALLLTNLNLLVDQAMASSLGSGSNAALGYASRIVTLVLSLGAISLATAAMPHFAAAVSEGRWDDLRRSLRQQTWLVLGAASVATVVLIVLAAPIVSVVLHIDAADDGGEVARTLAMFSLQIPGFTLVVLYARVMSALLANRLLVVVNGIALAVNTVADLVLRELYGVAGIALATSIVYTVSAVVLGVLVRRELLGRIAADAPPLQGPPGAGEVAS